MDGTNKHRILTLLVAAVWIANGLFCKVLDLVPRHEEIVGRILGEGGAGLITLLIGISEIGMGIWIVSRIQSKLNAVVQMTIIGSMNILEFILVPDLLLWGQMNIIFAFLLIGIIYYSEFILNKKLKSKSR